VADVHDETRHKDRTSPKFAAKRAATERIAAARAAEARAARRRNVMVAGGSILAVVIVIGAIVAYGLSHKKKTVTGSGNPVVPASATVTAGLSKAAGATGAVSGFSAVTGPPSRLTGAPLTGASGKPEVLYIGAEYCPYCAVTRWPLAVALSRFGTFSNLQTTTSSSTDTNPNTPTLSFHGATYKSDYIDFAGVEQEDGLGKPLESTTPAQEKVFESLAGGSYPFIDFGGKWMQKGASSDGAVLAGLTPDSVATQIADPTSKIGSSIQQGADVFTAAICGMDGGKPANVCTAPGVVTAVTALSGIK
jgi:hypothetical protein